MVIFDTNMILRYLLNDNQEMADQAEAYLDAGNVYVTIEVIAEVVYVLKGVYSMERETISETITDFLGLVKCREADVLTCALGLYGKRSFDFIDCVLYAYYKVRGFEIATFDQKLIKLMTSQR